MKIKNIGAIAGTTTLLGGAVASPIIASQLPQHKSITYKGNVVSSKKPTTDPREVGSKTDISHEKTLLGKLFPESKLKIALLRETMNN